MAKAVGKNVPLSPFRRMVTELMHFSRKVPCVTVERRMDLSALAAARECCSPRPSWAVLFTKAYALVSRDHPELRQSYLNFLWPRLYEHPHTIASVNIEREVADERIVMYCLIRSPENRSLAELDSIVRHHKDTPVEQLRTYQRALATSHLPYPLSRLFMWAALNLFGRHRCRNFGTFGLSSVGSQGAGLLTMIPVLTSSLHYGLFDKHSCLDVRLTWDHRVFDGGTGARIVVDLEKVLHCEILAELSSLRSLKAA